MKGVLLSPLTGAKVKSLKRKIVNQEGEVLWFGLTHEEMKLWNAHGPERFPLLNGDQGYSPKETYAVYDENKQLLPSDEWIPKILGEFAPFAVEKLQQVHLQAKACSSG